MTDRASLLCGRYLLTLSAVRTGLYASVNIFVIWYPTLVCYPVPRGRGVLARSGSVNYASCMMPMTSN